MAGEASKQIDSKILWGGGHRSPFSVSYGKMMMWFFLISDALTFGGGLTALGFAKHKHADVWPNSEDVFYHFPGTHEHLPLMYVALMTFILIVSSVTMVLAVEAGHRMDKKSVIKWMAWTVVGGFIFLGSQAWEWYTFIVGNGEHSLAMQLMDTSVSDHGIAHFLSDAKESLRLATGEIVTGAQMTEALQGAKQVIGANMESNEYGHPLYANFFFCITGFHGFHVFSGVIINLVILINVIAGTYEKRHHYEMVEKVGLYWHFVDLVWVFVFTFFYLV